MKAQEPLKVVSSAQGSQRQQKGSFVKAREPLKVVPSAHGSPLGSGFFFGFLFLVGEGALWLLQFKKFGESQPNQ